MPPISSWQSREGAPHPLGVSFVPEEDAYNFALFSRNATEVTLLFFRQDEWAQPCLEVPFEYLRHKTGPIWHCRLPAAELAGVGYYAYRVDGPARDGGFHCFDPDKLLLDPYATTVYFPPGFDREAAMRSGSNMGRAPLGVLRDSAHGCGYDWTGHERPMRHEADLVIYELHVKGFTAHPSSGIERPLRGTFEGVTRKIPYLKELGITAVELMPVFQYDPGEGNYWGYMPLNFFSPHHEYASTHTGCRQHDEFRAMVHALHAAGIEVLLDVVYNHTAECNHQGPLYSYKGIDNATYYMRSESLEDPYANYSGTGNTLHTTNRAVRRLILDSLIHWATEARVNGFRFDLASIFARSGDGSVAANDALIFGEIATHPELAGLRLIAEPWDAGGLYQLGKRFPGVTWMQWNAAYRETLQRFVRGDRGLVGDLMTRLYGSADLFPDDVYHAFRPFQSVNYITSHDGFTLYDLVSYNEKHNLANGHENQDGTHDYSWNCGVEGDAEATEAILQLRKQQVKNFCTLLMLSNGTPMFRMGDEFLKTQGGNNNPYNQDNETSWLNWSNLEAHADMFRFFKLMIAFRKAHPSLCRSTFWRGDIVWYGAKRETDWSEDSQQLAYCLRGASQRDDDLYVMINAGENAVNFGIHDLSGDAWRLVVDTSQLPPADIAEPGREIWLKRAEYPVAPRSVVVLRRSV